MEAHVRAAERDQPLADAPTATPEPPSWRAELPPAPERLRAAEDGGGAARAAERAAAEAAAAQRRAERVDATRFRDAVFRRSLVAADSVALLAALLLGAAVAGNSVTLAAILSPLVLVAIAKIMGLYDRDDHRLHKTTLQDVPPVLGISTAGAMITFLSGSLLYAAEPGRAEVVTVLLLLFVGMLSLRATARLLARLFTKPERCLLVGNSSRPLILLEALAMSPTTHAEIVGMLPMLTEASLDDSSPTALDDLLDEEMIDRVIVLPGSRGGNTLMFAIRELKDAGVKVSLLPDITRLAGTAFELDNIGGVTLMGMRRFAITRSSHLLKRWFDIVVASLLLLLMLPVLLVTTIAIRLDSPGPVLFRQARIGLHGRRFMMLKFRSMRDGAEHQREELRHLSEAARGLFKIPDDPRLTRVGSFIRRLSLDELPQLINVLRGNMSLVGPRPLVPEEDEQIVGRYRRRLDVRPGITGHWQVLGAARVSLDEMVKLDYLYIANWSLWNDIVLLLRTAPVVLRRRGM